MTAVEIEEWVLWINSEEARVYGKTPTMWLKLSSDDVLKILHWEGKGREL